MYLYNFRGEKSTIDIKKEHEWPRWRFSLSNVFNDKFFFFFLFEAKYSFWVNKTWKHFLKLITINLLIIYICLLSNFKFWHPQGLLKNIPFLTCQAYVKHNKKVIHLLPLKKTISILAIFQVHCCTLPWSTYKPKNRKRNIGVYKRETREHCPFVSLSGHVFSIYMF